MLNNVLPSMFTLVTPESSLQLTLKTFPRVFLLENKAFNSAELNATADQKSTEVMLTFAAESSQ